MNFQKILRKTFGERLRKKIENNTSIRFYEKRGKGKKGYFIEIDGECMKVTKGMYERDKEKFERKIEKSKKI